jgi:hypothetical protein
MEDERVLDDKADRLLLPRALLPNPDREDDPPSFFLLRLPLLLLPLLGAATATAATTSSLLGSWGLHAKHRPSRTTPGIVMGTILNNFLL